jgi:hypothetical protein
VRCGKLQEVSIGRRTRDVDQRQLGDERTVEHARDATVLVELAVDLGGRVFDPEVVEPSGEHLNEWTLSLIVRCRVALKNARCYGLWIAGHLNLRLELN